MNKLSNIIYYIQCLFIPQNRWARKAIPRTFSDFDYILENIAFDGLIFSWEEDGVGDSLKHNAEYDWHDVPDPESERTERKKIYLALKEAYEWACKRNELWDNIHATDFHEKWDKHIEEANKHLLNIMKYRGSIWT
jgi:hypothetical protein